MHRTRDIDEAEARYTYLTKETDEYLTRTDEVFQLVRNACHSAACKVMQGHPQWDRQDWEDAVTDSALIVMNQIYNKHNPRFLKEKRGKLITAVYWNVVGVFLGQKRQDEEAFRRTLTYAGWDNLETEEEEEKNECYYYDDNDED